MNKTVSHLNLLFQTTRHLTPQQIIHRLYYVVRKRFWRSIGKRAPLSEDCLLRDCEPLYLGVQAAAESSPWDQDCRKRLELASRIAEQRFRFLNEEVRYPNRVDWQDGRVNQLWRYHLHYFDYVEDMLLWAASGEDSLAWAAFCRLVDSWITGNEKVEGDGWHPFTISVRVVNWLHAFYFWKSRFDADADFSRRFTASLYGQAKILASSLEYDVRGNHLLKNLRALIWCGAAIDTAEAKSWMSLAMEAIEQEIVEQVLGDGGHFERVPGYHAAVFKDCLEIGLWLRRNHTGEATRWLDEALLRMLRYLMSILPPDGELPLLKDTALGVTPPPKDLLAAGALYFENPDFKINDEFGIYPMLLFGRKGQDTFRKWPLAHEELRSLGLPDTGYYVMRDASAGDYLVFDGGKVCPDYLPAHAHADMFSYELVVRGRRVVVDSGVYEYKAGGWRDYFRSTRAHNTVEVDGQNQSEVWGSFRVARRARPFQVSWKAEEDYNLVDARHDGYLRLPVPAIHRRVLLWMKGSFCLIVDELQSEDDVSIHRKDAKSAKIREESTRINESSCRTILRDPWRALRLSGEFFSSRQRLKSRGRGVNRFVRARSFVHLHPSIQAETLDSDRWRLDGLPQPMWIQAFGHSGSVMTGGQTEPFAQGCYSERFGERVPNSVLSIPKESNLPFLFGYAISNTEKLEIDFSTGERGQRKISVRDQRKSCKLLIERDGVRVLS